MSTTDWKALVCHTLEEKKASDIVCLDVSSLFPFSDTMIFATGASTRQLLTFASAIERAARDHGQRAMVQGKESDSWWIVISLPNVFVHLLLKEAREHFALEKLWSPKPKEHSDT